MGALDLNNIAIAMGKILKQMPVLEKISENWFAIDENKEKFFAMSYMARVSILDIIEKNPYMQNGALPIRIPLGIFKTRKETMENALDITIGRLLELSSNHEQVHNIVIGILQKEKAFYEFEQILPPHIISQFK